MFVGSLLNAVQTHEEGTAFYVMTLPEDQIAQALTVIEFDTFRQIQVLSQFFLCVRPFVRASTYGWTITDTQVTELLSQSWNKQKLKHRSPNVTALIQRFNLVANWVQNLSTPFLLLRSACLSRVDPSLCLAHIVLCDRTDRYLRRSSAPTASAHAQKCCASSWQ
jgi:hypothetical protein